MRTKGDWFQFATVNLEWVDPRMTLDVPRYVDNLLATMEQIDANALVYCYDSGGYPVYDSDLAPKDQHVREYDLMRLLRDGTRQRGLRLFIGFLGAPNRYVANTYPSWRVRDHEGKHEEWVSIRVCTNSPFSDFLAQLVGEAVDKYEPDGIYLEGIGPTICYCGYCQEKFRREYGRPIPTGIKSQVLADRQYTDFRFRSVSSVYRRVRAAIDRVAPQTVFVGCGYHVDTVDIRDVAPYVDAISMERQWGYGLALTALTLPLREIGLHVQAVRAESQRPVYCSMFIHKHVDRDYSPRSADHIRLNFMCIAQSGGTVQLHIQNEFEIDRTTVPVVKELYGAELKMRPYLLNAEIHGDAAIVDWADPRDTAARPDPALIGGAKPGSYLDDSFRGYYRALLEHHVPTRIMTIEQIEDGGLENLPVLILANVERLSDRLHDMIRQFVERGGGLVMTFRTGFRDERDERRERGDITALAGVKSRHGEIINPSPEFFVPPMTMLPQTYFRVADDEPEWSDLGGRLLSFQGSYVETEAEPDAEQFARVADYDYSRMHPDHTVIGWYPGDPIRPLIVGRQVGQGRAVYIAAELDGAFLRSGDPDALQVLAAAVRWVRRRKSTLETNTPPSVEITVHQTPDARKWCVLLTNQTTNQHYPDPIRYVVPIHDVEVRLVVGDTKVMNVHTVTGQRVDWTQNDGDLLMRIARLEAYEGLLIDTSG